MLLLGLKLCNPRGTYESWSLLQQTHQLPVAVTWDKPYTLLLEGGGEGAFIVVWRIWGQREWREGYTATAAFRAFFQNVVRLCYPLK